MSAHPVGVHRVAQVLLLLLLLLPLWGVSSHRRRPKLNHPTIAFMSETRGLEYEASF